MSLAASVRKRNGTMRPGAAGRKLLGLGHQHRGGVLGQRLRLGCLRSTPGGLTGAARAARRGTGGAAPGPQRAEQHPGRAERDVVDPGVREEPRWHRERLRPAVGRREHREPGDRVVCARGASAVSVPIVLTRPSKRVQSVWSGTIERTRSAIPAASSDSSLVQARASRISASTWASPPTPLCTPSRSHDSEGSIRSVSGWPVPGCSAGTVFGIQGPSSQRTWSSTHRQAASATSVYSRADFSGSAEFIAR